ncbi:MAG: protein translocase subunit SecF [Acidiferrobacterales bacterium]|nr:protein translocase subunit SecF [Acidiferrobacterales bacterium]
MEFLKKDLKIDFLGHRRVAAILSTVLIVAGLASIFVQGINWGLDFTGGTLVEVRYGEQVSVDEVRLQLAQSDIPDTTVQYFGTSQDVMIRLPSKNVEGTAAELSTRIVEALRAPYGETLTESTTGGLQNCRQAGNSVGECFVQMRRVEFVGPKVGEELTEQGGLAMLYALIGILIYVAWRFEWRFAIGSVVALVHDVFITIGMFSIFQIEFTLAVLAAVLAVIGYSLNDTIVVFDRIRENFRRSRQGTSVEIMNRSINQTLRRTILTSFTTLLVVVTLLVFGGEVIRGFSFALLIGVIVGTYSSIFIASPAVLALNITREDMAITEET